MSVGYILCFAGIIVILGIYAILWQQVLKKVPLSVAMANKPVALILSLLWAFFLFKEALSVKVLLGIALIIAGVILIGVNNDRA